jgi:hypothetical protein
MYPISAVLVFLFQSFSSMLMICKFICLGIGRIWMILISALNKDLAAISRWSAKNGLAILISNSAEHGAA